MAISGQLQHEFRRASKQQIVAGLPDKISSAVVPVLEINPHLSAEGFAATQSLTNSTSADLLVSDSSKRTFISSVSLYYVRDATATSTLFAIAITNPLERSQNILTVPGVTLTAGQGGISHVFPHPVEIKPGSTVTVTSSSNTGNFKVTANLNYYLDELES